MAAAVEGLREKGVELQRKLGNERVSGLYLQIELLVNKTEEGFFVDVAAGSLVKHYRPNAKGIIAFYLAEKGMSPEQLTERTERMARKVCRESLGHLNMENMDCWNWFEAERRVALGIYYFFIKYYSGVLKPHLTPHGNLVFYKNLEDLSWKLKDC